MNKDIVKLRNHYDKRSLQNKFRLKNTIKKIQNLKCKQYQQTYPHDFEINNELDLLFHDGKPDNFMIQTDTDLRMQIKPLNTFRNDQTNNTTHIANNMGCEDNVHKGEEDRIVINSNEIIDTVEKLSKQNSRDTNILSNEIDSVYNKTGGNITQLNNDKSCVSNEFRSDLQTLLIMMTINMRNEKDEENTMEGNETLHGSKDIIPKTKKGVKKETSEIIDVLSVKSLKSILQKRCEYLSKKYVKKWKEVINNRKMFMKKAREADLNNFLDKIAKKKNNVHNSQGSVSKAKNTCKDYSTYQHRYKVQQNIIALQKAKLEEQNKIIENLKYNKIVESSKQSLDIIREDIRKTYYEIDRQLKPKIKCLTNELNIRELEEPALVLHCLKVPQFLQRMEKRAREREEKHAMIRERRRQMEEERIRLKQQGELAKAEMDKEEKIKRMKELREKRKKEKIENIRRKQYAERMRALTVMADLHYEKTLLSKYGIYPFKQLLYIKRENIEKAKEHYLFQIKKNIFLHWMWYTEDMWFERNYKAENFLRQKLLRRAFDGLKKNHFEYVLKLQVAEDYHDLYVTQLVFRKFREGVEVFKKEFNVKWHRAAVYHNSNLLFKTFTCWRTLPALNAIKKEQEARKLRWREKVLQVVPDYEPPED